MVGNKAFIVLSVFSFQVKWEDAHANGKSRQFKNHTTKKNTETMAALAIRFRTPSIPSLQSSLEILVRRFRISSKKSTLALLMKRMRVKTLR
jgi:hypothetical protein